jgi:dienelactone hydrolase
MLLSCTHPPAQATPAVAAQPRAAEPLPLPATITAIRIPSAEGLLRGWVFRPEGPGPFPAFVWNHGSEKTPSLDVSTSVGTWFQEHGYAVVLPFRRGASGSEGHFWQDGLPSPASATYDAAAIAALEAENADVSSAIRWAREQPYVDGARLSVAGCSFGGIHTLFAAEKEQGLRAAVDFAGGAMWWPHSTMIKERLTRAVDNAKVPIFFIQAENDFSVEPSRVLSQEMTLRHLPHRVHVFPPRGATNRDAHAFCVRNVTEWGPEVLEFLENPRRLDGPEVTEAPEATYSSTATPAPGEVVLYDPDATSSRDPNVYGGDELAPGEGKRVLDSVFTGKYLENWGQCQAGSDSAAKERASGNIVPGIRAKATGSFTAPHVVESLYLIPVGECSHSSRGELWGSAVLAAFQGDVLVRKLPIDHNFFRIQAAPDLDGDDQSEILLRTSAGGQGELFETASLFRIEGDRLRVIKDFGVVVDTRCGMPKSYGQKKTFVYATPGSPPKFRIEKRREGCH